MPDGNGNHKSKSQQRKKKAFLTAFGQTGTVTAAAQLAGIDRKMHYTWLLQDEDGSYHKAFAEAEDIATERMEQEAIRRAVQGVPEPVFYQGQQVGYVQRYSDTLLMFMLKGQRPDKFRDNVRQEISGPNGGPVDMGFKIKIEDATKDEGNKPKD